MRDSRVRHGEGNHRSQIRDSEVQRRELAAQPPGRQAIKAIRWDPSEVTGAIELAVGREPCSQKKEALGKGEERWGQRV